MGESYGIWIIYQENKTAVILLKYIFLMMEELDHFLIFIRHVFILF